MSIIRRTMLKPTAGSAAPSQADAFWSGAGIVPVAIERGGIEVLCTKPLRGKVAPGGRPVAPGHPRFIRADRYVA